MWGLTLQLKEAQHNAIIAANRIKELEAIIEQGLAYVNHLEEEQKRMKGLLKIGINDGWSRDEEREVRDIVYGSS